MSQLLIATANLHKLEEIKTILGTPAPCLLSLRDVAPYSEPIESAATFEGNALIKALAAVRATGLPALADDSGLIVHALNGEPGVNSARYAGEHGNTLANNEKLLKNLSGITERQASFCCVVALVFPNEEAFTYRGEIHGSILEQPRGEGGFGYDPLFVPDGYSQTFAELPPEVKNQLSHRGLALAEMKTSEAYRLLLTL